jgi:hypothetical protein
MAATGAGPASSRRSFSRHFRQLTGGTLGDWLLRERLALAQRGRVSLIFKIVPRAEWEAESGDYHGSAHDRADGFLHFSTAAQLPETLRLYYAGQDDLMLVAVAAEALGTAL